MVLTVLRNLNGQNHVGRSLFDKGSTNRGKNGGQMPNKKFPNKRWYVASMNRLTKKMTTAGQLNGTQAVAVRGL